MKQNRILVISIMVADLILAVVCMTIYFGEDRVRPEFRFQMEDYIYSRGEEEKLLENIRAYDNRDGDITDRIVIEKITENPDNSTIVVYYAVSDSAGNVAKISRVFVADLEDREKTVEEEAMVLEKAPESTALNVETIAKKEHQLPGQPGHEVSGTETDAVQKEDNAAEAGEENGAADRSQAGGNGDTDRPAEGDGEGNRDTGHRAEEDGEGNRDTGHRAEGDGEGNRDTDRQTEGAGGENRDRSLPQTAETEEGNREQGENRPSEAEQKDTGSGPVLTLQTQEVTIDAGTSPPWTEIIETLQDDKDDYATLYYNLSVSRFNRNQAGDYPVSLYTEDSDGNRSDTVSVLVHVK